MAISTVWDDVASIFGRRRDFMMPYTGKTVTYTKNRKKHRVPCVTTVEFWMLNLVISKIKRHFNTNRKAESRTILWNIRRCRVTCQDVYRCWKWIYWTLLGKWRNTNVTYLCLLFNYSYFYHPGSKKSQLPFDDISDDELHRKALNCQYQKQRIFADAILI